MAITVRCILCINKEFERLDKLSKVEGWNPKDLEAKKQDHVNHMAYEIGSKMIAKDDREAMNNLGQEIAMHLKNHHEPHLMEVAKLSVQFNGFNVMKYFEAENEKELYEVQKETMRDELETAILYGAPDDEDEFEDEDDLEEEDDDDILKEEEEDDDEEDNMFENENEDEVGGEETSFQNENHL